MQKAAKAVESKKCAKNVRIPRKIVAFQHVAAQGERKLINWFVNKEEVNVDSRDRNGNTALICAAANGKDGGVGKLLELGADSNAKNKFGQTALMLAAASGHLGTARILLAYRAKAYLKDNEGRRAYEYARINGHYKVARLIEQSQESLNKGARDAIRRGSSGELDYYLCNGAEPASLGPALDF